LFLVFRYMVHMTGAVMAFGNMIPHGFSDDSETAFMDTDIAQ
jgi:hypothetical protein